MMRAGMKRWLMVMLGVGNLKPPLVVRLLILFCLHLEDHQLEGTSRLACTCTPDCRLGSVCPGLVTLITVTCLDSRVGWSRPIETEAVAMLHPMACQRVESFFVGSIRAIGWWINDLFVAGFHCETCLALDWIEVHVKVVLKRLDRGDETDIRRDGGEGILTPYQIGLAWEDK